MNRSVFFAVLAILIFFTQNVFGDLLSFQQEAERATKILECPKAKITPASSGLGAIYGCIVGSSETVKFFINEGEDAGKVKNVKLMWNDWFVDMGYGKHADKKLPLRSGLRVLDLGCGRAMISIYLAKELGVQVWATDLWITPDHNWSRVVELNEPL